MLSFTEAPGDDACDQGLFREVSDNIDDFEAVDTSAIDADDSSGLLVPASKAGSEKGNRKKSFTSSSRDAIRFFLGEKPGMRDASRDVRDELSALSEGVKRTTMAKQRTGGGLLKGTRTVNIKRQSRRSSVLKNRTQKMRAAASWENREAVVYRSTRCLGQMLNLVLKQVRTRALASSEFPLSFDQVNMFS